MTVETDGVRVLPEREVDFVTMLFDDDALRDWPRGYAGGGVDEPACKRQRLGSDPLTSLAAGGWVHCRNTVGCAEA